ncbi:MAG: sodium:proton exchanger [Acidimicrobiia bacterium]|nr:sodium:proton exchanger [Acidimicrobiia bacterium]
MDSSRTRGQLIAIAMAVAVTIPGLFLRITGIHGTAWVDAILFGMAVIGSAFLLAWAAEALQLDVSQGLALAVLALIAVLPEYAVDFVFTSKAGTNPDKYAPLALANMTGGNRLLIGIGWSMVVLLAAWRMRRIAQDDGYEGGLDEEVSLTRSHSIEIGFLAVATLYSLTLPLKRTITLTDAVVLASLFLAYIVRVARAPAEEPHLVGPAQFIGGLPRRQRRIVVGLLLVFAAGVIVLCAEGFAESLVETGQEFGISQFLLVQWLAPLASEAPELLVAGLFAWRLNTEAGLGTLVSSKVNQWTLLVGTLPIVFAVSSSSWHGLPLDTLQREELFLTAAQSAYAVAVLTDRTISVKEAATLLGLFLSQFVLGAVLPDGIHEVERILVGSVYLILAAAIFYGKRRTLRALLRDAFRTPLTELARGDAPEMEATP